MNDTNKIEQLCQLFNQIINQYGSLEKELHTYGTQTPLHLSEIHTIVSIGKHPSINITNLAKLQGISRSAASQMVSRLTARGFVKKEISPQTDNEVILSLTETGNEVFQIHEKQHQWLRGRLRVVFEKYPGDTLDVLLKIGLDIQDLWTDLPCLDSYPAASDYPQPRL